MSVARRMGRCSRSSFVKETAGDRVQTCDGQGVSVLKGESEGKKREPAGPSQRGLALGGQRNVGGGVFVRRRPPHSERSFYCDSPSTE